MPPPPPGVNRVNKFEFSLYTALPEFSITCNGFGVWKENNKVNNLKALETLKTLYSKN